MAGKSTDRSAMAVRNMPVRIAAVYLVIGILWIIFSDRLAEQIAADVPTLTLIQTYKGWFYVFVTAALLYLLTKSYDRSVNISRRQLMKSRQHYKTLVENVDDWIVSINKDDIIVYASPKSKDSLGYESSEIMGKNILDVIRPDSRILKHDIYPVFNKRQTFRYLQIEAKMKNGALVYLELNGVPRFHEGKFRGYCMIIRNITQQKLTQDKLVESENLFRAVTETTAAGIFIVQDNDFAYVNKAVENISGYSREEIHKIHFLDFVHPDYKELVGQRAQERISGHEVPSHYEFKIMRKNDKARWLDYTGKLIQFKGKPAILGSVFDITERKKIEQELMDSRETYRSLAQTASDGIITIDDRSKILFVNDAVQRIFGYQKNELVGKQLTMLMPERKRGRHLNSIKSYLKTGVKHTSWRNLELPGLHKNGYEVPIEISYGEFIKGGHHFFTGIIRDITGRKTVEDALRESEGKYRKLVESANDAIIIADIDSGKIIDVNKRAEGLLDRPADELIGQKQTILHPTGEDRRYHDIFERAIKSGQMIAKDLYVQRKDGSRVPVEISSSVTDLKGRKIVQGIFRDITERKQSEEALKNKDAQIRKTYVDVFSAVTGGRLIIMTEEELTEALGEPVSDKIEIPSYEALSEARHIIINTVNFNFPTIDRVDDIITAVNEALTNAVKHAGNGSLRIFESKKTAQIMISDNGPGIDFSILPKATLLSGFSTKQSLGMGFSIMLEYSDRLLLSTKPGQTIIVLEVNI